MTLAFLIIRASASCLKHCLRRNASQHISDCHC
uniref:Uncharacterized protein n=1 Tax=Rhizophora mucronata TaxID=61149 RepID=A0A2P2NBD8_RHIMU